MIIMSKRLKGLLCLLIALCVVFTSVFVYAEQNEPEVSDTSSSEAVSEQTTGKPKKKPYTGWKKTKSGKKRYYIKGKLVKYKSIKIKKYRYCFNKKGYLVTKRSYKIGKKTYYLSKKGRVRAFKKGKTYYKRNGKKMNESQTLDWKTRMTAEKLAAKITDKSMKKSEKLKVCFDWVMKKYYVQHRRFNPNVYWPAIYANDHFSNIGGDCHADAGALAYLAVAIGYKNVYVCNDSNGTRAEGHSWCEIGGKVYDPLFAQAKSYSKYYGCSYSTYKLYPILHIKMDYNKNRPKR